MRVVARRGRRAGVDQRGQRRVTRRPDVERNAHRRRRDAVEDDAAHAIRVAAQVFQRDTRAVRAAPQIDPVVAHRRAHGVEIGDPRLGRVLARIDAARGELARARGGAVHWIDVERGAKRILRRERCAVERRRPAGASRVDEDDVAILAHAGQLRGEGAEVRCRLSGPAGEDEQRIGLRIERVCG